LATPKIGAQINSSATGQEDPETTRGLMQGDTIARLILTDEPYNVKKSPGMSPAHVIANSPWRRAR
jgi:hypothetical protein